MIDISTHEIHLHTEGFNQIFDITNEIQQILDESEYIEGQITVFCPGSTGGITNIEYEPGLLRDLPEFLETIIPMKKSYHHDDTWHDGNGYAHLRSALIKPHFTVPFSQNRLLLGTWQQIIFIDFDNKSRRRELIVQILGKKKQTGK